MFLIQKNMINDFNKIDKEFGDINFYKAKCFFKSGQKNFELEKFDDALNDFKKVKELYEEFRDINLQIAKCNLNLGNYKVAFSLYDSFLQKNHKNKEAFNGAARCLFVLGKDKDLEALCNLYIQLDPANMEPYLYRGICKSHQNKKESSKKDILKACEFLEDYDVFQFQLDEIYSEKAKFQTGKSHNGQDAEYSLRTVKDGNDLNTKKRYEIRKQLESLDFIYDLEF